MHKRGTIVVLKGKWGFSCRGFRKVRMPEAWYLAKPPMKCR